MAEKWLIKLLGEVESRVMFCYAVMRNALFHGHARYLPYTII